MSKDLTAALDALTREAAGQTSRVDKALPAAAAAQPIPARSGTGKPAAASVWVASDKPLVETCLNIGFDKGRVPARHRHNDIDSCLGELAARELLRKESHPVPAQRLNNNCREQARRLGAPR